jgi:hypothetical protein
MPYTKTWNIGERCMGGVITVNVYGKIIHVVNRQWDFTKGTKHSSDQRKSPILQTGTTESTDPDAHRKLYNYISYLANDYWAEQIITWINKKVTLIQP